jgi:uncharacterized protein YndB with AHSA1/START domain
MSAIPVMKVEQEEFIQAAPEKVWSVLAETEGIRQWLGPNQYEPHQGAKITFDVAHGGKQFLMFGEVVTFDPPRELAFTWTEQEIGHDPWPVPTLVTLTLTPEGGGTRVRLVHSGFEHLPAAMAQPQYDSYVAGWAMRPVLRGLKELVEHA